jgi:hypothetical protein
MSCAEVSQYVKTVPINSARVSAKLHTFYLHTMSSTKPHRVFTILYFEPVPGKPGTFACDETNIPKRTHRSKEDANLFAMKLAREKKKKGEYIFTNTLYAQTFHGRLCYMWRRKNKVGQVPGYIEVRAATSDPITKTINVSSNLPEKQPWNEITYPLPDIIFKKGASTQSKEQTASQTPPEHAAEFARIFNESWTTDDIEGILEEQDEVSVGNCDTLNTPGFFTPNANALGRSKSEGAAPEPTGDSS